MLRKDVIGNMEEKQQSNLDIIKELIPLFSIEIVLLSLMNFAGLAIIYRLLATVLMVIAVMQIIKNMPKDKLIIPFVIQLASLFIFVLLSILFGGYSQSVYDFNTFLVVVAIILGGLSFYILGCYYGFFKDNSKLDFTKIISVTYIGLGIYVLICLIATIYGMGRPFHVITFANPELGRTELQYQARILSGFSTELRADGVGILSDIALLTSTGVLVSLFVDRKTNKFFFYGTLLGGLCGLALLILFPAVLSLIIFLLSFILVNILKNNFKHKKVLLIAFIAFVLVLLILYALFRIDYHKNPYEYEGISYFVKAVLVQNSGISSRLNYVKDMLKHFPILIGETTGVEHYSGNFILDIAYHSGLIPLIAIITFLVMSFRSIIKYFKRNDNIAIKVAVIVLPLYYLYHLMLNGNVGFQLLHDFAFLGVLLLLGYVSGFNLHSSADKQKSLQ